MKQNSNKPSNKKSQGLVSNASNDETPTFANGDLGNVQKFLFGEPISRLSTDIEQLEARLESIELNLRGEIDDLDAELRRETKARTAAEQNLSDHIATSTATLNERVSDLTAAGDQADKALEALLAQSIDQWQVKLDLTREELHEKLVGAATRLQSQKVDRRSMAALLSGIAEQIDTDASDIDLSWLDMEPTGG